MKDLQKLVAQVFENVEFPTEPKGLYEPLDYMIRIGGKRIRPTLCLLTYSLFGKEFDESIISPAVSLEVFHTFTLIHDDIMDKSPLRRGMPTVWTKWNEDTAILSGDVMLIDAYKRLAKAPAACLTKCFDLFSKTAAEVCEGQQLDMNFEQREDVSMAEYEQMIGLKTAVLIACAAKMGAIIAGASDLQQEALYRYAYDLGMAFQVADDYLDAFGDEKVFGKPIGGDILQQKKSWLTIMAVSKADDVESFMRIFRSKDIDKVKDCYRHLRVDEDAKEEIARYNALAIKELVDAGFDEAAIAQLKDFADSLVGRVK